MRPTLELLRSFSREAWATSLVLAQWLFLAIANTPVAASNALLLWNVASLGCLVGSRVGELRAWPGTVLAAGYTRSLLTVCVVGTGSSTIAAAACCWFLGNSVPGIAPAFLVGLVVVRITIGAPIAPALIVVWNWLGVFALLYATILEAGTGAPSRLVDATSALSHLPAQIASLLAAILVLHALRRAVRLPARRNLARQTAAANTLLRMNWLSGFAHAAVILGIIVPIWYWSPKLAQWGFVVIWSFSLGQALLEWSMTAINVQMSRNWIFATATDRRDLGRRAAAYSLWLSLPWLVVGIGWSAIHALVKDADEDLFLSDVLCVQITAILAVTVWFNLARKLPPSAPVMFVAFVVLLTMVATGSAALSFIEYTAMGQVALVFALVGAAALAVFGGGRGLARAEILSETPVRPGFTRQVR